MQTKLPASRMHLLHLLTCLSLVSSMKIIAQVGEPIILPCNVNTNGNIQWSKNDRPLRFFNNRQTNNDKDTSQWLKQSGSNNLEVAKVQSSDAGNFSCSNEKIELFVIQVLVQPSATLIVSETLRLVLKSSPEVALQVSWWKDQKQIRAGTTLEKANVQIEESGTYTCRVTMGSADEKTLHTEITVKGFKASRAIVYTSTKKPVILPFIFNFKVREIPLAGDVGVVEGNITYPSKRIEKLRVTTGAACWPEKCDQKRSPEESYDLNAYVPKPTSGFYRMEIVLKVERREKKLSRDVCVANLTVFTSPKDIGMESNVTLHCNVNCIDSDGKLCWHHRTIGPEICGPVGRNTLALNVTAMPDTVGNWTCFVMVGKERKVSANLILEVQPDFLDLSNYLFWVTVGAGILVFLIIVVIVTVMIGRRRRVRRARYRAWLLENLHQQRRCQCKGFAPVRLIENI